MKSRVAKHNVNRLHSIRDLAMQSKASDQLIHERHHPK